jgi:quaternary ammonium compound-resistance protein SugE
LSIDGRSAWLLLAVAGLLEIVWAIALKQSEGFTRLVPSVIGVIGSLASFGLLTLALGHLPAGTAYAVWVGIGAAGVAVVGILRLGEPATPLRLACISLVVIGAIGLRALDG